MSNGELNDYTKRLYDKAEELFMLHGHGGVKKLKDACPPTRNKYIWMAREEVKE